MKTNAILLQRLVRVCEDGAEGYLLAAGQVHDPDLRTLLIFCSERRGNLAWDLRALLHRVGHDQPPGAGSVLGAAHRMWMRLQNAVASQDEGHILEECERGEEMAMAEYRLALHDERWPETSALLRAHLRIITAARDHIYDRRRRLSANAQPASASVRSGDSEVHAAA